MSDQLASALLTETNLRLVVATTRKLSVDAQVLHGSAPASAHLLAQGLTAAALLGGLQKDRTRINLQIECDGPIRGIFVDGDAQGLVRGYAKNTQVGFQGPPGEFQWRPVLGNKGFLSVLRDLGGGEYYRSSVELTHFELGRDLEAFFETSEQLPSAVFIHSRGDEEGRLTAVGGLLLQTLPDGDRETFAQQRARLREGQLFEKALAAAPDASPTQLMTTLFPQPDLEVMSTFPLRFSCSCSRERVMRALVAMGRSELADLLAKEGKAEVTCEFCTTKYEVGPEEIKALLSPQTGA